METVFIYALCEPGTRTVRYIGRTTNIKKRLREHLCKTQNPSNHRSCWLLSLISKGFKPEMVVLREVPTSEWRAAEERYVRLARGCGMDLVNGSDGGDGRVNNSPETRKKMSDCKLGPKNPMFGKTGPSNPAFGKPSPLKGLPRTEEDVAKMKENHTRGKDHHFFGKTYSEEERLALSMIGKRGKKRAGSSSKFLGVCWQKAAKKWAAAICVGGGNLWLGLFSDEHEAARAYDKAALHQLGLTAPLNFPL